MLDGSAEGFGTGCGKGFIGAGCCSGERLGGVLFGSCGEGSWGAGDCFGAGSVGAGCGWEEGAGGLLFGSCCEGSWGAGSCFGAGSVGAGCGWEEGAGGVLFGSCGEGSWGAGDCFGAGSVGAGWGWEEGSGGLFCGGSGRDGQKRSGASDGPLVNAERGSDGRAISPSSWLGVSGASRPKIGVRPPYGDRELLLVAGLPSSASARRNP